MPHHVTSLFEQQMNWEAVATFSAGVLAVLAALAIGFLQSKIIARQTRIQEVTLRHELWERRFNDVYTPIMKMLSGIDYAYSDTNHETKLAFLRAIEQSRFLFDRKVYLELRAIGGAVSEILNLMADLTVDIDNSDRFGLANTLERKIIKLRETENRLPGLFMPSLSLAIEDTTIDDYFVGPDISEATDTAAALRTSVHRFANVVPPGDQ